MADQVDHLSEWMKLQEETNKQAALALKQLATVVLDLNERLKALEAGHHAILERLRDLAAVVLGEER